MGLDPVLGQDPYSSHSLPIVWTSFLSIAQVSPDIVLGIMSHVVASNTSRMDQWSSMPLPLVPAFFQVRSSSSFVHSGARLKYPLLYHYSNNFPLVNQNSD